MWLYDLVDPQELQGFVRGVQQELESNQFVLNQFLPNDDIDDIEYRITQGEFLDQDVAMFRTWDTEAPIGARQGLRRLMGELPPLSKKIPLGEEARLRRRALERGNNAELVRQIFDDARNLARSIAGRIELARGEVLYTGSLVINENGVEQTVDFQRDAAHEVTAATPWSTVDTATPIADYTTWVQAYLDKNGVMPRAALTSRAVINWLLRNEEIRSLYASLSGTPRIVSNEALNTVLGSFDLPPILTYDVKVRVEGVQQRVIPEDRFILLPPANEPLGRTFFGTTVEALELVGARQINQDQAMGLTAVIEKTFDPVRIWTKVAGVALPVLANPDLTFVADVL